MREIRRHYLKTWFIVDFVACLPMTYVSAVIALLSDEDVMSEGGSKFVRAIRIIRLSKLLRLARLQVCACVRACSVPVCLPARAPVRPSVRPSV